MRIRLIRERGREKKSAMEARMTPARAGYGLALTVLLGLPFPLGCETITMSTTYPSPVGIYARIITTGGSSGAPVDTILSRDRGNVGIGTPSTTNPFGGKLVVRDDTQDSQLTVMSDREGPFAGGGKTSISIENLDTNNNGGPSALRFGRGNSTRWAWVNDVDGNATDSMTLWQAGGYKRLTIDTAGNVGIGTTLPSFWSKLEVAGALSLSARVPGGLNVAAMTSEASGLPLLLKARAGDYPDFVVNPSGNVGIGTMIPAARLQVGSSGDGSVALANAWNTFSSRRFKENVHPIGGALDKINRLRGVEFEWKGSGKRDLGVVAEEVGQVFPEIVDYETGSRDARGLDYSKLVAPLIEAVKELETRNEAQQAEIDGLKKELRDLKTR